jgi:hypothetical protein
MPVSLKTGMSGLPMRKNTVVAQAPLVCRRWVAHGKVHVARSEYVPHKADCLALDSGDHHVSHTQSLSPLSGLLQEIVHCSFLLVANARA